MGDENPESNERVGQILRVDASALLKTIRDLEYRLTDHQRQDKIPEWALALEARLDRLEKTHFEVQDSASIAGSKTLDEESGHEVEKLPMSPVQNRNNIQDERLYNRFRSEVEMKVGSAQINFDSKLSTMSLEIDRLHKLLQIRPTTSEIQSVVMSVHDMEKKIQESVGNISNELLSTVRSDISEEMISIIDGLHASKKAAEERMQLMLRRVEEQANELNQMRVGAEDGISALDAKIAQMAEESLKFQEHMALMKEQFVKDQSQLSDVFQNIQASQNMEKEALKAKVDMIAASISDVNRFSDQTQQIVKKEVESLEERVMLLTVENEQLAKDVLGIKNKQDEEMEELKVSHSYNSDGLVEQQIKLREMKGAIEGIVGMDYAGKIATLNELHEASKEEFKGFVGKFKTFVEEDVGNINQQIGWLQEQCNVQIPKVYMEQSMKIDKLSEGFKASEDAIDLLRTRLKNTDDLLDTMLPIKDQVTSLEDSQVDMEKELQSLKGTMTTQIDTADELGRRLEELEQTVEQMDDSIANRVDRIRDALMDTLLEKQTETQSVVTNVKENLEVLSMAGDMPGVKAPRARRGAISPVPEMANLVAGGGRASRRASLRPMGSFRRPSIAGAAVEGGAPPRSSGNRGFEIDDSEDEYGSPSGTAGSVSRQSSRTATAPSTASAMARRTGGASILNRRTSVSRGGGLQGTTPPTRQSVDGSAELVSMSSGGIDMPVSDMELNLSSAPGTAGSTLGDSKQSISSQRRNSQGKPSDAIQPMEDGTGTTGRRASNTALTPQQQEIMMQEGYSAEYSQVLTGDEEDEAPFFSQLQYLSDLCINFEDISMKKKRVINMPSVFCESISEITQELAEFIAKLSDYEMVQHMLTTASVNASKAANELHYDENFVLNHRHFKTEEFLDQITQMVVEGGAQVTPGIVRLDARTLFLSLTRKALELFLSKHNQVLVAGNSRLGKIKIPSCVACDRPLLDKVSLDSIVDHSGEMSAPGGSLLGGGSNSLLRWGDSDEEDDAGPRNRRKRPPGTAPASMSSPLYLLDSHADQGSIYSQISGSRAGKSKLSALVEHPDPASALPLSRRPTKISADHRNSMKQSKSLSSVSEPTAPYVLKGGFKMPKPASRGGLQLPAV